MRKFASNWKGNLAAAVAGAMMLALVISAVATRPAYAQKERKYVNNQEFDAYNEVLKDMNAKNFAKMLTDLDTWTQKYPTTEYSDIRDVLYVQANAGSGKCAKAVSLAGDMMAKDLDKLYPDPGEGPGNVITILYTTLGCTAAAQSQQEFDTIGKAAEMLKGYERRPKGMTDQAWSDLKKQLTPAAEATLMAVALTPGAKAMAMNPPDCPAAEKAYTAALEKFPNNTAASYGLGRAWLCLGRANNQEKIKEYGPKAIYEFARSAAIDPTLAKTSADPKVAVNNATNIYTSYHGSKDGLEQLMEESKKSTLPPAGFTIKTAGEVDEEKEKAFQSQYPELAMWLNLKRPLADPATGEQYFQSSVKDTDYPKLKGTLAEAVPACRPKSLLVSFPEPNQQGTAANVITLKLDSALAGKPEIGGVIEFKGVPTAFTPSPFMLTLETEKANITGIKTTPCVATPAKATPKKGVGTKKK